MKADNPVVQILKQTPYDLASPPLSVAFLLWPTWSPPACHFGQMWCAHPLSTSKLCSSDMAALNLHGTKRSMVDHGSEESQLSTTWPKPMLHLVPMLNDVTLIILSTEMSLGTHSDDHDNDTLAT